MSRDALTRYQGMSEGDEQKQWVTITAGSSDVFSYSIAARFIYEWRDAAGAWFRSHGNEQWAFDVDGLMRRREASINDVPIGEAERLFRWPLGPRPDGHPGLSELGL